MKINEFPTKKGGFHLRVTFPIQHALAAMLPQHPFQKLPGSRGGLGCDVWVPVFGMPDQSGIPQNCVKLRVRLEKKIVFE